jgi:hypothetical protein
VPPLISANLKGPDGATSVFSLTKRRSLRAHPEVS